MALYLGKDKIAGSGKSGSEHVYLTQEQYEALSAQGKLQASTVYMTPGGGSGGDVGGLSSQLSAHDREMKELMEGRYANISALISAHDASVNTRLLNMQQKLDGLADANSTAPCLDYGFAVSYSLGAQTLSASPLLFDAQLFFPSAYDLSVDGVAVPKCAMVANPGNGSESGLSNSWYVNVPAGVTLAIKKNSGGKDGMAVVPYRYGRKIQLPGQQQTATIESVFKSGSLAGFVEPVSVSMTGTDVGGEWLSGGSWDENHYDYAESGGQAGFYKFSSGMSMTVKAKKTIILNFTSNYGIGYTWGSRPTIKYAVGNSAKISPNSAFAYGNMIAVGAGQYLAISQSCETTTYYKADPQTGFAYLACTKANQFFANLTVQEQSFVLVG